jgi:hypothetical protein
MGHSGFSGWRRTGGVCSASGAAGRKSGDGDASARSWSSACAPEDYADLHAALKLPGHIVECAPRFVRRDGFRDRERNLRCAVPAW